MREKLSNSRGEEGSSSSLSSLTCVPGHGCLGLRVSGEDGHSWLGRERCHLMGSCCLCNATPVLSGCGWIDGGGREGGREGGRREEGREDVHTTANHIHVHEHIK